jgi:uncharacterized protein involved in outer membrane biogenesis
MRRFILISILVLAVLIVVTAGVGLYLLNNEAFLKSQLSSNTLKYTGRELTLDGPLTLDLGRVSTLEANGIHFANPEWAEDPDMVSIGRLKISLQLSSLFGDRPVIPFFSLDDCRVTLLRKDEDVPNWDLFPDRPPETEPEPEPVPDQDQGKKLPLRVLDVEIRNCEVYIASLKIDEPLDIKVSELSMQHHDDSRWQGKASGSVNELGLSLDGWFAPFSAVIHGGPLEHEFKIQVEDIFTAHSAGSIADASDWSGANITANFSGPEIGVLLSEFKLPPFSEGAFDYRLKLNTEGEMTRLDLDGDLGSMQITADGELDRLVRPGKGNVSIAIDGPNLGALARVFDIEGVVEEEFQHRLESSLEDGRIHFRNHTLKTGIDELQVTGHFSTAAGFAGTDLNFHLKSEEAGRWARLAGKEQHELGPLDLEGELSSDQDGLFSITSNATLASSTLYVDGALGHFPGAIKPDLNVTFHSDDPTELATLSGWQDIPGVPLAVTGRVGFGDQKLSLENVQIELSGDTADIDGHLMLVDRYAGSEATIKLDINNVEALGRLFQQEGYPDQPLKLTALLEPRGKGLDFKVGDSKLGAIRLDLQGHIADLEQMDGLDADFDISLPRLSDVSFLAPNLNLPAAPFKATGHAGFKDKSVQLDEVHIELATSTADINGRLNLKDRYKGSELNIDVDIEHANRLGKLFGKEGFPDQPLKLSAVLKPDGKGLGFQVNDGNLGDIQLDLEGSIADLDQPTALDASFDIRLLRMSDIAFLVPDKTLPDVPFTANGRLINEETRTRLDGVRITLGKGSASIDGSLLPDNGFDLDIRANGEDASKLAGLLGTTLPARPFSVSTHIAGKPAEFDLDGLDVTLGNSKAAGDLKIGLGDATLIEGRIVSPNMDLSHWYPGDQPEQEAEPATESADREWMFDDTEVMTLTSHGTDIDLDLRVDQLNLGNTLVEDIDLKLVLADRLLKVGPFSLKGELGGSYRGQLSLDGRSGTPRLHVDVKGKDVRMGIAALPEQDPNTYPPIELDLLLDGEGETRRTMASSLDGHFRAYMGSGQLAAAGLDLLFSDFITQLLTQLNPFHEESEYTQVDCAVFSADAESGVVKVLPIIFHTDKLTMFSDGVVDLNTEGIDLSFNTKPRQGIGLSAGALINPLIKVGGRLVSPAVEMDAGGTVVSGGLAVATIGISVLAKSMSDRFLSSPDPCGDARKEIEKAYKAD